MKTPEYWLAEWSDGTREKFDTKGMADKTRKERGIKPKDCKLIPGPMAKRVTPFNPNSRDQVRKLLLDRYNWLSPSLTEAGEKLVGTVPSEQLAQDYGSLSEEILRDCPFPLGQKFASRFLLGKIASFLSNRDGKSGWLSLVRDGKIHHRCITIGCATFRVSCSRPNLSQVPHTILDKATKQPLFGLTGRFGADCRSLFRCTPGMRFVGADLSGIEAVMLASYLFPYDGGAYANMVISGDIHKANQDAIKSHAGFSISRSDVKTAFYGYAYSAGDLKLGHILMSTTPDALECFNQRRDFYRRNTGLIKSKVWSLAIKNRRTATPDEAALIDIGAKIR